MAWPMVWRFILLLLYLSGNYFLDRWLRRNFPPISKVYVYKSLRPWIAIFLLWGPTLWFVPGLFWFRIIPVLFPILLIVSFLTPLLVHAWYMWRRGLFSFTLPLDRLLTIGIFFVIFLAWGLSLVLMPSWEGMNRLLYVGFFLSLIVPAVTANELFRNTLPQMVPEHLEDLDGVDLMETMVVGYYTTVPKPVWFIDDGKVETRIKGNALMGTGASLLTTEPENVAGRKAGPQFVGINLPGTTLVDNGTVPSMTIDLRNQIRMDKVECITLDGIAVKVPISSLFRIDWNKRSPEFEHPWPFSRPGVEMACISDLVDPKDKTPLEEQVSHKWDDLPLLYARKALRRAIHFYTLDQLYGPSASELASAANTNSLPSALVKLYAAHNQASMELLGKPFNPATAPPLTRQVIGKIVQDYVRNELAPRHYTILGGGIGNAIEPVSPMVSVQRIEAWKGHVDQRMLDWQGDIRERRYTKALQGQEEALVNYLNAVFSPASVAQLGTVNPMALRGLYLLRQLFQLAGQQETDFLLQDKAYPAKLWLKPQLSKEDES